MRGAPDRLQRRDGLGAGDPARADARRHRRVVARADPGRGLGPARVVGAQVEPLAVGAALRVVLVRHQRDSPSRTPGARAPRASSGVAPSRCAVQAIVCTGAALRDALVHDAAHVERLVGERVDRVRDGAARRRRTSSSGPRRRAGSSGGPQRARRARRRAPCAGACRRPGCRRRRTGRCPRRCPGPIERRKPGQCTSTGRPAISEAIASMRRSLVTRLWRAASHHAGSPTAHDARGSP